MNHFKIKRMIRPGTRLMPSDWFKDDQNYGPVIVIGQPKDYGIEYVEAKSEINGQISNWHISNLREIK